MKNKEKTIKSVLDRLDKVVLTLKVRGSNGRFKTARSMTALDWLVYVDKLKATVPSIRWYDKLLCTKRYKDNLISTAFNEGTTYQLYAIAEEMLEMTNAKNQK